MAASPIPDPWTHNDDDMWLLHGDHSNGDVLSTLPGPAKPLVRRRGSGAMEEAAAAAARKSSVKGSLGDAVARQLAKEQGPQRSSDFFAKIDGEVEDIIGKIVTDYGRDIAREIEESEDRHRPNLQRLTRYTVELPRPVSTEPGQRLRDMPSSDSLNGSVASFGSIGRRGRRPPSELLDGQRPTDFFNFSEEAPRTSQSPGPTGRRTPTAAASPLRGRMSTDEPRSSSLGSIGKLAQRLSLDFPQGGSPKLGATRTSFETSELRSLGLRSMYGSHVNLPDRKPAGSSGSGR